MIDAAYMADALAWSLVWIAAGLTGRELLARHDRHAQQRRQGGR